MDSTQSIKMYVIATKIDFNIKDRLSSPSRRLDNHTMLRNDSVSG